VYIRKTGKTYKGKTSDNYLLVESVSTPKGPRQKILCSLGSLAPAPREHWLELAHRVEASLSGQLALGSADATLPTLIEKGRRRRKPRSLAAPINEAAVAVDSERVSREEACEAGAVHGGHQRWEQLGLNEILQAAGLSDRACRLSEAMALNRLIFPLSEHAMPDWIRSTALADIVGMDFSSLKDDVLYRNLERLHPHRERIERELAEREKTLFSLDNRLYLYDLTSTYFEGQAESNPQAKRLLVR
jgi:hypothetical protein